MQQSHNVTPADVYFGRDKAIWNAPAEVVHLLG